LYHNLLNTSICDILRKIWHISIHRWLYNAILAPHHGSRKSNSPALAAWCRPRWVVFSGDGRWSLPEAEAPYRAVGGEVLGTAERGAIHVGITAKGVDVSGFVQPHR
jgi:competence protein ComEC